MPLILLIEYHSHEHLCALHVFFDSTHIVNFLIIFIINFNFGSEMLGLEKTGFVDGGVKDASRANNFLIFFFNN